MEYPSKRIENAVTEVSKLPGIGKKSALRLVLHLLKSDLSQVEALSGALIDLVKNTGFCTLCHNVSDSEQCHICTSLKRDKKVIAVVQDIRDVMALENTGQFQGLYHVLGGVISPINGIGPQELFIDDLVNRVSQNPDISEIILALSPTMEGDTTAFYIKKKLEGLPLKISTIARGIPLGTDLEYTDEITLGRSILSRINF